MSRWPDPEDRFWSYVERREKNECWLWHGPVDSDGYGQIYWNGALVGAARLMLFFQGEDLSDGLCACHTCDNPPCVNPYHLFAGTKKDNYDDMVEKGRAVKACGDRNGSRLHPESRLRGDAHPYAKLTTDNVIRIRSDSRSGAAIARELGLPRATVNNARRGKTWAHVKSDLVPSTPIVDGGAP